MIEFSDEDLQKPVRVVIEKIRPYLLKDGGNIEVLGVKSMKIYVALERACKTCSSSKITLKNVIERQLKMDIHPNLEVVCLENAKEFHEL
ncbi:NifU family protein [Helicobacter pylori]|uniref:NifU family protein n=1 Tax=Helicobacter pylori TaxID=210 RepID=UPI001FD5BDCF|nr:NifU family protein [Helicobacter pylori]UOR22305.1 NifU family protein [Helicobacter pylori]